MHLRVSLLGTQNSWFCHSQKIESVLEDLFDIGALVLTWFVDLPVIHGVEATQQESWSAFGNEAPSLDASNS